MNYEMLFPPMERLHLGDYVQVKDLNICGVIVNITRYNNHSIDGCEYYLSFEDVDLERVPWFTRQELIFITAWSYNADEDSE